MSLAEHDQEPRRLPIAVLGPARDALPNGECVNAWIARRPDGATLEEVGEAFGTTRERIRQIEEAALMKLRVRTSAADRARGEVQAPKAVPPVRQPGIAPPRRRASSAPWPSQAIVSAFPVGARIPDTRLTVTGYEREVYKYSQSGAVAASRTMIVLSCDCGTSRHTSQVGALKSGATRSCGCLRRVANEAKRKPPVDAAVLSEVVVAPESKPKAVREPKTKRPPPPRVTETYPVGMRIEGSRLTVSGHRREQFKATRKGKTRFEWRTLVLCDCDCGTRDHAAQLANLKSGTTRSCGCLAREMANGGKKAA